jgi:myo-inositol-1(or 4)-monophosphatase
VLNFATQVAREAGGLLIQRLGAAKITNKGDINLVTEADIAAENLIIERIRSRYPQHGILAEESGEAVLAGGRRSEWKWIVDPLDGTTNYAHGYPCFCVSIALEHQGALEIGVVYDPTRDEMFAAERGEGATLNDRSIRVSAVEQLNDAMVCTGFPYNVRERADFARDFTRFTMAAQAVRRDGSAALDLAYVACGRFDGFWEDGLSPWDIAAGALLISEAGGKITNFSNEPLDIYNEQVIASNGLVHEAMLGVLSTDFADSTD